MTIIATFGLLILAIGLLAFVKPSAFAAMLRPPSAQTIWVLAVVVRLGFGILLLIVAESLRFSIVMTALGWIAIAAAIVILLMGPERLEKLVTWWLTRSDALLRISALFAAAFGAFLIYVAV